MSGIEGHVLKLDPSVPYIFVLPERTPESTVAQLTKNLGQANVQATILVGDLKNIRIFGSLPWSVEPRETVADKYCEGHEQKKLTDGAPAKTKKARAPRKAVSKKKKEPLCL